MVAKTNTTKRISLAGGSAESGKTVPGPGNVRGGGQTAATANPGSKSGSKTSMGGFGLARGLQKGRGKM